jgi:peptide/nickel transport system permease protein
VRFAWVIILEASLSFLGAGVPPEQPSLGRLILNGYQMLFSGYWWISALPGLALVLLVLGVNLLGDWLREAMNPKLAR